MADGLRTIRVLTTDESLQASAQAAVAPLDGWEVVQVPGESELLAEPPVAGDVLLVDSWLRGTNVYELTRRLTGRMRCRTFVVFEQGNEIAAPIARFCGATGTLNRPVTASSLRVALEASTGPPPALPQEARGEENGVFELPESLLKDITTGKRDEGLIDAVIDPETGLFNYAFLNYKLDEEFKRARRFDSPVSCVMLGFEGQADEAVLRELAAIFLQSSRDTDILGRFDENTFLFLLPHTGPDGAVVMARRVAELAEERGLRDLVGDPVQLSVGISSFPHPEFQRREDLYGAARGAHMSARQEGGGIVRAN